MGDLISSIGGAFGLGGNNTGGQAAGAQNASLDQAIAELRRQFSQTQENISPFIQGGQGALPGVIEGTTAGGLDARLGRIFDTDTFGQLVDERTRAVQGGLAAGGLTRSGAGIQELANIPTSIGLQLEQLLTSRGTGLANAGQNAALGLGQLGGQNAGNIAGLFGQQGVNTGSGIITDAQSQAQGTQNLLGSASTASSALGIPDFLTGAAQTAASFFFSDPTLKENVEKIGEIGALGIYQWDWVAETKGTMIEKCGTIGFMADEVTTVFPKCVSEFAGFMIIDYPRLLDKLEAA